jgi:hypothetical protein
MAVATTITIKGTAFNPGFVAPNTEKNYNHHNQR